MTAVLAAAGSNSTALWYLSRGTGAVALVLLTGTLALGIADVTRWRSQRWPRFVVDALHGTLSLAAIVLLVGHVLTSVLDPFAPLRLTDAVLPFAGQYRPVWVGLGALSFDLLLVLVITSVWRRHIGPRAWRAVHWTAYACWPLALVHTLGTGSDVRRGWMLALAAACTAVVVIALGTRLAAARGPGARIARPATLAAMAAGVLALAVWLPLGPLAHDWARRAGTPVALLTRPATAVAQPPAPAPPALHLPFTARADGRLRSGVAGDGTALVDIALRVADGSHATLDIRLAGSPLAGGGVSVDRSQVTFGPPSDPARYIGRLVTLDGTTLDARLRPAHGRAVRVHALLNLGNGGSGPVSATVSARRETA
jgi:DMSO/TMAO reductase YedYZ heme-binding membrane subunit